MSCLSRSLRHHRPTIAVSILAGFSAACGDSATDPESQALAVAGVYFGAITYGTATCTPSFPPAFDPSRYTVRTLLELTQSGTSLTGVDHLGPGVTISGSVNTDRVELRQTFGWSDSDGTVTVEGNYDLRLDTSNRLSGTGTLRADGTVAPANVRIICTRPTTVEAVRTGPIVDLAATPCATEPTMRSPNTSAWALIVWHHPSDRNLRISRIDQEGRRVFEGVMVAGGVSSTLTYDNHAYIITDLDDRCVGIYVAAAGGPRRVKLR